MAELPPTTRDVCDAIGRGLSEAEVAETFGLTARAVESHLTRARRRLRKLRIAVVIPIGLGFARFVQRFAAPLTCAAVAAPVAAVLLLPRPAQPLPHAEAPVAETTTAPVVTTAVATTVVPTRAFVPTTTTSPVPSAVPPLAATTTHATRVPDVTLKPKVDSVVTDVLRQVPTTLPSLPSLPPPLPGVSPRPPVGR
jgi:hypothetical protein